MKGLSLQAGLAHESRMHLKLLFEVDGATLDTALTMFVPSRFRMSSSSSSSCFGSGLTEPLVGATLMKKIF